MKPRRVRLILDVETDVPLPVLRKERYYNPLLIKPRIGYAESLKVLRAEAEVLEPWDEKEVEHASRA